ncbi:MAG TPA: ABC transporter ATP-binding protein [candidate division Zixibacteria bacterium]|nr:ABC transporter ATP-binding protein [candidate division Zixibacteria bacterium]MDD4917707.1 ABC transporter ATP-binding protein [candidate division Zixibacteria bacterium]MDM7973578.1 ABC transporter ATP-binding protein [candidate division Zixibacteria bacterium]HPM36913.1 ABC transporter ATP-binding protein [candidate division Zixibacteria bacterium]
MIPDPRTRRRLWSWLRPYWRLEALMFVIMLVMTALALMLPQAIRYMIDDLIPSLRADTDGSVDMAPAVWFGLALIGLYLSSFVFSIGRDYLAGKVGASIIADLRAALFDHLAQVPLRFYQTNNVGEIMSRLLADVQRVQSLLTTTLLMFLTNILMLLGILVTLFVFNWIWAALALIPVPIIVWLSHRYGISLHAINYRLQESIAQLSGRLQEVFSTIRTVRAFAQERREKTRVVGVLSAMTGLYIRNSVMTSLAVNLVQLVASLVPVIVLSWGAYLVAAGSFPLGALFMFYIYLGYLYSPIQELSQVNVEVQSAMASVYRIFEYFDLPQAVAEDPQPVRLAEVRGRLAFEDVDFHYGGDNGFAIRALSLTIEPGEKVAIVGPSGAGKTTLINLLLRFYDPEGGRILLDRVDLRRLALKELRSHMGLVDQDPVLFKASLRDNIAYGRAEASMDRVIEAARVANIHDFIEKLPLGYETEVGERGVTLSGGERQRVCLARAILLNPPIMLLDEATSALDTRSEELIQQALEKALQGKTSIIIAHRLATVRHADRIIVLDNGRIVGEGTHEALLESSPLYGELARKQLLT